MLLPFSDPFLETPSTSEQTGRLVLWQAGGKSCQGLYIVQIESYGISRDGEQIKPTWTVNHAQES